ncbi:MAG: hypothetical protein AAFW87_11130, partial [Pseudomonadota bacterium]
YTLRPEDDGTFISVRITWQDSNGALETTSGGVTAHYRTPIVQGAAPSVSAGEASGISTVDVSIAFSGDGLTYSLIQSPDPVNVSINSVTGVLSVDTGETGALVDAPYTVQAQNSGGVAVASGTLTVTELALVVETLPSIAGTPEVGQTLSLDDGVATGEGTVSVIARQWWRDGVVLAGETGETYLVDPADAATSLTAQVTWQDNDEQVMASSATVTIAQPTPSFNEQVLQDLNYASMAPATPDDPTPFTPGDGSGITNLSLEVGGTFRFVTDSGAQCMEFSAQPKTGSAFPKAGFKDVLWGGTANDGLRMPQSGDTLITELMIKFVGPDISNLYFLDHECYELQTEQQVVNGLGMRRRIGAGGFYEVDISEFYSGFSPASRTTTFSPVPDIWYAFRSEMVLGSSAATGRVTERFNDQVVLDVAMPTFFDRDGFEQNTGGFRIQPEPYVIALDQFEYGVTANNDPINGKTIRVRWAKLTHRWSD